MGDAQGKTLVGDTELPHTLRTCQPPSTTVCAPAVKLLEPHFSRGSSMQAQLITLLATGDRAPATLPHPVFWKGCRMVPPSGHVPGCLPGVASPAL